MDISVLRERIVAARRHEQSETALRDWLAERLPGLELAIRSGQDEMTTMLKFIDAYIVQVPDLLEAAQVVAQTAGIGEQLSPVLKVAEAFFQQPPDLPIDHRGMLALLDEAYLAHRLVEEVNDRYVGHGCGPLIPLDMTRANLIAHQLLGEPFSNDLDLIVTQALERLVPESLFEGEAFQRYQASVNPESCRALWQEWPCMSETLGVGIKWRGAA